MALKRPFTADYPLHYDNKPDELRNGLHDLRSNLRDRADPDWEGERSAKELAQEIQGILDDLWTIRGKEQNGASPVTLQ